MCNRYVSPDQAEIERLWHIGRHNQPRLWRAAEVFPRAQGPFIRTETGEHDARERSLVIGQCRTPDMRFLTG
jgi:hypothetical protein